MGINNPWPTGVAHLDQVLGGGLPRGTVALIVGVPGSGKTTLASQLVFSQVQTGKRGLILSALSESTAALISHLSTYQFYQPELVGGPIQIQSLRQTLAGGLPAAKNEVIDAVRRNRADIVLIDGIHGLQSSTAGGTELRQFFYDVSTTLATLGVTTLVTSEANPHAQDVFPEATTADIVIGLQFSLRGVRQTRGLEIIKTRGAQPLPGLHMMTINASGIHLYPQLEERVAADILGGDAQTQGAARTAEDPPSPMLSPMAVFTNARATFDLPRLDDILGGGLPTGTTTVLAGSIGVGKTMFATAFALAGVRADEPVVFLSFRETRDQLLRSASPFNVGGRLHEAFASGRLTHIAIPAIKINPDIVADRLLNTLDQTQAKRLVIDSIVELEAAIQTSAAPERLREYFAAILTALHQRGVTALLTKETPKAVASTLDFTAEPLAVLAESVILAQHVTYRGRLHRLVSILKLRYGSHNPTVHRFQIVPPEGLEVLGPWDEFVDDIPPITNEQSGKRKGKDSGAPHG